MNTLWREGKTDEAVSAVEDMERRGIVGSAALYYDLARCLCSAGKCEEALMQVDLSCLILFTFFFFLIFAALPLYIYSFLA